MVKHLGLADGHVSTCHLDFFLFLFLLYIGFVSMANNLTLHWCAWDHAACMCMGPPRTDWHVSMCIGGELGYLPYSYTCGCGDYKVNGVIRSHAVDAHRPT